MEKNNLHFIVTIKSINTYAERGLPARLHFTCMYVLMLKIKHYSTSQRTLLIDAYFTSFNKTCFGVVPYIEKSHPNVT